MRGTPGSPPPSVPSPPPFHLAAPGPQIPPVIPVIPLLPLFLLLIPTAVLPSFLSQQLVHPQPLSWLLVDARRVEGSGSDRPTPLPQPVCLSVYLSPVSHKHIAIRNASTLVQSCTSVNTSLLVVCIVDLSASLSMSPCLYVFKPLAYTVQQSRKISGIQ